jgi:hypothetical protein
MITYVLSPSLASFVGKRHLPGTKATRGYPWRAQVPTAITCVPRKIGSGREVRQTRTGSGLGWPGEVGDRLSVNIAKQEGEKKRQRGRKL